MSDNETPRTLDDLYAFAPPTWWLDKSPRGKPSEDWALLLELGSRVYLPFRHLQNRVKV